MMRRILFFLSYTTSLLAFVTQRIPQPRTAQQLYAEYQHALAILALPTSSPDRIANEAVLNAIMPHTRKLSIVLRCLNEATPTTAELRGYVGEVYSQLWDVLSLRPELPDIVIYPQNLPNAAPESWILIQEDLDCVCSLDDTVGWQSSAESPRGQQFASSSSYGLGGLQDHVANINTERDNRNLPPVAALPVPRPAHWVNPQIVFLDDDDNDEPTTAQESVLLAGATPSSNLFGSVCVGGTFDGLHFGHRKLLTLAASSVTPVTGTLLVGVTVDAMLRKKEYSEFIPSFDQRCRGVREFLYRLAPGMKDRLQIRAITDSFGPPATEPFDALVLSHETLETGVALNEHRTANGLEPLALLCTRRTEAHGMSSTALRRMRSQRTVEENRTL